MLNIFNRADIVNWRQFFCFKLKVSRRWADLQWNELIVKKYTLMSSKMFMTSIYVGWFKDVELEFSTMSTLGDDLWSFVQEISSREVGNLEFFCETQVAAFVVGSVWLGFANDSPGYTRMAVEIFYAPYFCRQGCVVTIPLKIEGWLVACVSFFECTFAKSNVM